MADKQDHFTCIYGCNQLQSGLTLEDFQNHFLNIHLKNNFLSKQFQEDLKEDFEISKAGEIETENLKNLTNFKWEFLLQKNQGFEDKINTLDGIKLYENDVTELTNDIHATSPDDSKTISDHSRPENLKKSREKNCEIK